MSYQIDESVRTYGFNLLQKHTQGIQKEVDGVMLAEDIEYIHRMRVASRRLRNAFALFSDLIPQKRYKRWLKAVRNITSSLGAARDLDVQLEYLDSYLKETNEPRDLPGISRLKLKLGRKRENLQDGVIRTLEEVTKDQTLEKMIDYFDLSAQQNESIAVDPVESNEQRNISEGVAAGNSEDNEPAETSEENKDTTTQESDTIDNTDNADNADNADNVDSASEVPQETIEQPEQTESEPTPYSQALYHRAVKTVYKNISDLFEHEVYIFDPTNKEELHEMRIKAKWLRYSLESYAALYPDELKKFISIIKKIQDYLGTIHDLDVWMELLPRFIRKEAKQSQRYFLSEKPFELLRVGLDDFMADTTAKRQALYLDFINDWNGWKTEGIWDSLKAALTDPISQAGATANSQA